MPRLEVTGEQIGEIRGYARALGGELLDNLGRYSGSYGEVWVVNGEPFVIREAFNGRPSRGLDTLFCSDGQAKELASRGILRYDRSSAQRVRFVES